jgi:hypothetical protein
MFDSSLDACLNELMEMPGGSIEELVTKYCPIKMLEYPPRPSLEFYRSDLIEDKYIPSLDILSNLNTTLTKTLNLELKPSNSKLQ